MLTSQYPAHLSWVVVCFGVVDFGNLQAVQVTRDYQHTHTESQAAARTNQDEPV